MTNEEAITIMKDAKITYIAPNGKQLSNEAREMAIKALEFKTNYYKFWEEVKLAGYEGREVEIHKDGKSIYDKRGGSMTLEDAIKHAEEVCAEEHKQLAEWLKELKAYKENIAVWIDHSEDDLKISDYKCSKCGYWMDDKTKYCQNCGAKMKGIE